MLQPVDRIQVYLTGEQRRRLAEWAAREGASQAELIRQMLDRELGILQDPDGPVAVVRATSGVMADYPDWPKWLGAVRGKDSDDGLGEPIR